MIIRNLLGLLIGFDPPLDEMVIFWGSWSIIACLFQSLVNIAMSFLLDLRIDASPKSKNSH